MRRVAGHPGVVRLLGVVHAPGHLLMRMERAGGSSLLAVIEEGGRLEPPRARRLFGQLAAALAHCHRRGVAHLDLKPENLAVGGGDGGERLRLMDFGCASRAGAPRDDVVGTMPFIAPEVLMVLVAGRPYIPAAADLWSAGAVLLEMLMGVGALSRALGWPPVPPPTAERAQELLSWARSGDDVLAEARLPGPLLIFPPTERASARDLEEWSLLLEEA